jgi:hypothetical protein
MSSVRKPLVEEDVLKNLLTEIYENPDVLSGSGSDHEEMFEKLLKARGIDYVRHPKGTQQSPDFIVFDRWSIELKSTRTDRIFLNDGFFVDDYIYIISRTKKSMRDSIIALGRDVYTKEERVVLTEFRDDLDRLKKKYKLDPSFNLSLYPRAANTYGLNLDRAMLFNRIKTELE